ncbi:MAG TPA: type 1 glutamine amidotransferase [Actinotalea sp.]|nr:type 1 glutamine amidotransferase [Actinotalea sp.]
MILTVIENMPSVPLDRFAGWLTETPERAEPAVTLSLVRAWAGDPIPSLAECGDGLLVLGGQGHALDDAGCPWLPATRALLAEAATSGLPTLGICLGAQLLAVATGGRVQVAAPPGREAGVIDLHPRPEAAADALLGGLAADVPADHPLNGGVLAAMPSMHADAVVDLPSGAVWLASSRLYPYQAFRVGSAWGLQFHPEVGEATFTAWAELHDDVDTDDVVAQLRSRADEVDHAGREIAQRFAALVRQRAALALTR